MKTVVLVLLVLGALVLGNNYLQTGKIGFNVSLSEDERELRALDEQLSAFREARTCIDRVNRRTGSNEASVTQLRDSVSLLLSEAETLRAEVQRLRH